MDDAIFNQNELLVMERASQKLVIRAGFLVPYLFDPLKILFLGFHIFLAEAPCVEFFKEH